MIAWRSAAVTWTRISILNIYFMFENFLAKLSLLFQWEQFVESD